MPLVNREKLYNMRDYPELTSKNGSPAGLVIGAGAGPELQRRFFENFGGGPQILDP